MISMEVSTHIPNLAGACDDVLDAVLDDITDEARSSMEGEKHGRVYKLYQPPALPRRHVASAPGEAPAIQYGDLYASIHSERWGTGGRVIASSEHAGYQEHGTRNMLPRPFMAPAARAAVRRKTRYEHIFVSEVESYG